MLISNGTCLKEQTRLKERPSEPIHRIALALIALALSAVSASAQNPSPPSQLRLTPPQVKAARSRLPSVIGSSGNSRVKEVVIHGDPSKPGLYTVLLEVGPNAHIAAHFHPDDRMATVVSGVWYFGYGPKFDAAKLKRLPMGSIYAEPARADHFAMTRGPVIVEITGYGPSGVTYIHPNVAPARSASASRRPS